MCISNADDDNCITRIPNFEEVARSLRGVGRLWLHKIVVSMMPAGANASAISANLVFSSRDVFFALDRRREGWL